MSNSNPMGISSLTNGCSLRNERNKTASTKYRAKKNQQYNEMKVILTNLSKENKLLLHQLDHLYKENKKFPKELDRLHGQARAQKTIKQYLRQSHFGETSFKNLSIGVRTISNLLKYNSE